MVICLLRFCKTVILCVSYGCRQSWCDCERQQTKRFTFLLATRREHHSDTRQPIYSCTRTPRDRRGPVHAVPLPVSRVNAARGGGGTNERQLSLDSTAVLYSLFRLVVFSLLQAAAKSYKKSRNIPKKDI